MRRRRLLREEGAPHGGGTVWLLAGVERPLASLLRGNTVLLGFNLQSNDIHPAKAKALAEGLSVSTSLMYCDISNNPIGDEGMQAIGHALLGSNKSQLHALKCDAFELTAETTSLQISNKGMPAIVLLSGVLRAHGSLTNLK